MGNLFLGQFIEGNENFVPTDFGEYELVRRVSLSSRSRLGHREAPWTSWQRPFPPRPAGAREVPAMTPPSMLNQNKMLECLHVFSQRRIMKIVSYQISSGRKHTSCLSQSVCVLPCSPGDIFNPSVLESDSVRT